MEKTPPGDAPSPVKRLPPLPAFPALSGLVDLKRARVAAGLGLIWAVLVSLFHFGGFFDGAEERLLDWETTWIASAPAPADKAAYALLSIDRVPSDRPWPWPRLDYAILLRGLLPEHPRSVVFEMLMHDEDPRYTAFDDTFSSLVQRCGTGNAVFAAAALETDGKTPPPEGALALPVLGPDAKEVKDGNAAAPAAGLPARYRSLFWPVPTFSAGSLVGVANLGPDGDGVLRRVPLLFQVREKLLPSLALAAAAVRIGADLQRSEVRPGREIVLRNSAGTVLRRVPIDKAGRLRLRLRSPGLPLVRIDNDDFVLGADRVDRGLAPDVPLSDLGGRQVWIGATDPAVAKPFLTAVGLRAPVEVQMAASAQIVRGDFLHPIPKALASLLFLVTGGVLAYAARRFHFGRAILLIVVTLASIAAVSLLAVAVANVVFPLVALGVLGTGVILSGLAAGAWEVGAGAGEPAAPGEAESP